MKNTAKQLAYRNLRIARVKWPRELRGNELQILRSLTNQYGLSISLGDLLFLDSKWYVTHAGLLRLSQRRRCSGIQTALQKDVSDPSANRWVFKATVYRTLDSKGFVGYGDADPLSRAVR